MPITQKLNSVENIYKKLNDVEKFAQQHEIREIFIKISRRDSSLLVAREHEDIEDKGGGNGNVVKEESIVDPDGTTVFFTVKRSFILKEEIDPR